MTALSTPASLYPLRWLWHSFTNNRRVWNAHNPLGTRINFNATLCGLACLVNLAVGLSPRRNSPNIPFSSVPRKISRVHATLRSADLELQYSLKGHGSLVREDVEGGRCLAFRACSRQRCLVVKAVRQLGMFRSSVNRLLPL